MKKEKKNGKGVAGERRVPKTRRQRLGRKPTPPTQDSRHRSEEWAVRLEECSSEVDAYIKEINSHCLEIDEKHFQRVKEQMGGERWAGDAQRGRITAAMRRMLLKWVMSVVACLKMKQDTLHCCVQLVDFMLIFSPQSIHKHNLQLLGVGALFVSAKYNEIHTHDALKFVSLCSGLYTLADLLAMESIILLATSFNLQFPLLPTYTLPFTHGLLPALQAKAADCVHTLTCVAILDFELSNYCRKAHLSLIISYLTCKIINLELHLPPTPIPTKQLQYYMQKLIDGYLLLSGKPSFSA